MRAPKFVFIWDKQIATHVICLKETIARIELLKDTWRAGARMTIFLFENNKRCHFELVLHFTSPIEAECLIERLVKTPTMLPAICCKGFKAYGIKCTLYNLTLN